MGWADLFSGIGEGAEAGGRFYAWAKNQETDQANRDEDRAFRERTLASSEKQSELDREIRKILLEMEQKHGLTVQSTEHAFRAGEGEKGRTHETSLQGARFGHDKDMQGARFAFEGTENAADRSQRSSLAYADRDVRMSEGTANRALDAWRTRAGFEMDRYQTDSAAARVDPLGGSAPRSVPRLPEPPAEAVPRGRGPLPAPRPRGEVPIKPRAVAAPAAPAAAPPAAAGGRTQDSVAQELSVAIGLAAAAQGPEKLRALARVAALRAELGGGR